MPYSTFNSSGIALEEKPLLLSSLILSIGNSNDFRPLDLQSFIWDIFVSIGGRNSWTISSVYAVALLFDSTRT